MQPRRLIPVLAAAATALALGAAGVAAFLVRSADDGPPLTAAPFAAQPNPVAPTKPAPSPADISTRTPDPEHPVQPWGGVVSTGTMVGDREVVLYVRAMNEPVLPGITFGVSLGLRDAAGQLTAGPATNEFRPPADSVGFHGWWGSTGVDGGWPEFGYFVGPAVRIVISAPGRADVLAQQAAWDVRSDIVLFWLPPESGEGATITAFDAAGNALPAGYNQRSVG